ncbi:uncharacterized protein EI97DRAFT_504620 [Westerdykella ornata]|uniref:Uncharacterized protein n=1 Tax=Westerdykella ornata TaxID=318751 RepID=A0A6A6J5R5_WESOR|nr:uncharacterized protein EI97DRAFT_504620 [Westerdykella ornata]KAF2271921.1 hypothetical protein EI97DRAFT_504620 [Westerdykella ornata]
MLMPRDQDILSLPLDNETSSFQTNPIVQIIGTKAVDPFYLINIVAWPILIPVIPLLYVILLYANPPRRNGPSTRESGGLNQDEDAAVQRPAPPPEPEYLEDEPAPDPAMLLIKVWLNLMTRVASLLVWIMILEVAGAFRLDDVLCETIPRGNIAKVMYCDGKRLLDSKLTHLVALLATWRVLRWMRSLAQEEERDMKDYLKRLRRLEERLEATEVLVREYKRLGEVLKLMEMEVKRREEDSERVKKEHECYKEAVEELKRRAEAAGVDIGNLSVHS